MQSHLSQGDPKSLTQKCTASSVSPSNQVGHGSARHVGEKLSSGFIVTLLELAGWAAGVPIELIVPASQSLITLPNSRK
jgi:hypothetical protein